MMKAACDATDEKNRNKCPFCYIFAKKQKKVNVVIYTNKKTKLTQQDIQKFNAQYPNLTLKYTNKMHDRFTIIDGTTLYHIGASLKDLGKKCFAFEILDASIINAILANI